MRSLNLSKSGINKVRGHQLELKVSDFEDSIKSLPPGEWCFMKLSPTEYAVGFVNPLIEEKYVCSHVVSRVSVDEMKSFSVEAFISGKITASVARRRSIKGYEKNARMFYGVSDGLPGLIVDQFNNASIIQINTAGLDRHRELILKAVSEATDSRGYFLDNPKYREKESLPVFGVEPLPALDITENGLTFRIRSEVVQKVGFYYDHRENRLNLSRLLGRLNKNFSNGVDLFSYVGAWGVSALKSGVQDMHFVDQGDFEPEIAASLTLNGFDGKGKFYRSDVFKYLDDCVNRKIRFDLILCDPPAFAKSALQKPQALEGYSKLHRKVFRILAPGGVVAFSSCTHYVGHEEFQKNIQDAAARENRKIQLVYTGMQGFDHPVTSLEDRSNYIKSYFYIVE